MALFVLSLCPFDISVGVGAFVIGLSQISSFFSYYWSWPYNRIWLFTLLREVSIEHLQRVLHANRGCFLLLTPGPVPLWDLQVFQCWDQYLLNLSCFWTFEFRTSLGTSVFALQCKLIALPGRFKTQCDLLMFCHHRDYDTISISKYAIKERFLKVWIIESTTSIGSRVTNLGRGWYDVTNPSRGVAETGMWHRITRDRDLSLWIRY